MENKLDKHTPKITDRLKHKPALSLAGEDVLRELFPNYKEIVVRKYFTEGWSGSWVILVRPILEKGAELPVVVKIDRSWRVKKESDAFNKHIDKKLPYCADIYPNRVISGDREYGGLVYKMVGADQFNTKSLLQFCLDAEWADIETLLRDQLFKSLSLLWGSARTPKYEMHVQTQYDAILPVNFGIELVDIEDGQFPIKVSPDTIHEHFFNLNDIVEVSGFQVVNFNFDSNQLSLDIPSSLDDVYRFHMKSVPNIETYTHNQIVDRRFIGRVTKTRHSALLEQAQKLVDIRTDLSAEKINLFDDTHRCLPNPITHLPRVLEHTFDADLAYIHGDFHLQNVVIESEHAYLIDFAHARKDHILRDLMHLESDVITRVLPEFLKLNNYEPTVICTFYEQLHFAQQSALHTDLLNGLGKPFSILKTIRKAAQSLLFYADNWNEYYYGLYIYLLGSLRFKSLDKLDEAPVPKQLAFWGAATLLELIENPPSIISSLSDENKKPSQKKGVNMSSQEERRGSSEEHNNQQESGTKPDSNDNKWNIPLTKKEFRQKLNDYFSLSDLKTLAFDLEIDYDEFGPVGKAQFIPEFIRYLENKSRIRQLWQMCRDQRPNTNWD